MRRVTSLISCVAFGAAVLAFAPGAGSAAPGSPQCNATGGNVIAASGSHFVHTFTGGGTFTPKQTMDVEYLVVGGGGGGGPVSNRRMAGGGGGGGNVVTGTVSVTANTGYTITIGDGGTAGSGTTRGGTGGTSSFGALASAAGGGGGGAGATNINGVDGTSGGGGGGATAATTGGTGSSGGNGGSGFIGANTTRAAAGGGGDGGNGSNGASSTGGNGGAGTSSSIDGTATTYGAGGGGGSSTTGGTGGSGAGNGGTASSPNGGTATANRGGGGGGAGNHTVSGQSNAGGAGGSGIVIIRYLKNAGCPNEPGSASFSNPTFSWSAPSSIPSGQSISSYTVVYREQGAAAQGWGIYARNGTATSINLTGKTVVACGLVNASPWTCVLGKGNLVAGRTYEFRVFARTNTNGLSKMSSIVTHTPV